MRIDHRTMDWLVRVIILIGERSRVKCVTLDQEDTMTRSSKLSIRNRRTGAYKLQSKIEARKHYSTARAIEVLQLAGAPNGPTVMKRASVSTLPLAKPAPAFVLVVSGAAPAATRRRLTALPFDRYRPERHYMRGPGPKWHAVRCQAEARETAGRL
jgi:hypothetical protein